jgi:hypothetical protein
VAVEVSILLLGILRNEITTVSAAFVVVLEARMATSEGRTCSIRSDRNGRASRASDILQKIGGGAPVDAVTHLPSDQESTDPANLTTTCDVAFD